MCCYTFTKVFISYRWHWLQVFSFHFYTDIILVLFYPISSLAWCYFVVLLKLSPGSSVLSNFNTCSEMSTYHSHNESETEFSLKLEGWKKLRRPFSRCSRTKVFTVGPYQYLLLQSGWILLLGISECTIICICSTRYGRTQTGGGRGLN